MQYFRKGCMYTPGTVDYDLQELLFALFQTGQFMRDQDCGHIVTMFQPFPAVFEVYTLEVYHKSMVSGLMVYGMMRATKKSVPSPQ